MPTWNWSSARSAAIVPPSPGPTVDDTAVDDTAVDAAVVLWKPYTRFGECYSRIEGQRLKGSGGRLRDGGLLPGQRAAGRPIPLLRRHARAVPGAARIPAWRGDGHGVRRGGRGVPRPRGILVMRLGDRPVPRVPGTARGRRRERPD